MFLLFANWRYNKLPSARPSFLPTPYIDLINSVKYIFEGFDSLSDNAKKDLLLYGDPRFDINKNKFILEATLFYIKSTERFSGSLIE